MQDAALAPVEGCQDGVFFYLLLNANVNETICFKLQYGVMQVYLHAFVKLDGGGECHRRGNKVQGNPLNAGRDPRVGLGGTEKDEPIPYGNQSQSICSVFLPFHSLEEYFTYKEVTWCIFPR